jgi:hypothetical protein
VRLSRIQGGFEGGSGEAVPGDFPAVYDHHWYGISIFLQIIGVFIDIPNLQFKRTLGGDVMQHLFYQFAQMATGTGIKDDVIHRK